MTYPRRPPRPDPPDGFCDRCKQAVWTRSDGSLMGHPCSPTATTTPDEPTDSLPDAKGQEPA